MTDGWWDRSWAPLYALVITFALVVITGAALDTPPQPVALQPLVQFTITTVGDPTPPLPEGLRVRVMRDEQVLATLEHGVPGQFALQFPPEKVQVCLDLPPKWSIDDSQHNPTSRPWCRDVRREVRIVLRRVA